MAVVQTYFYRIWTENGEHWNGNELNCENQIVGDKVFVYGNYYGNCKRENHPYKLSLMITNTVS